MITTGSSMQAMTFMAPLQALQISMSILKTRLGHCALVNAMDGMYAGFAGAKTGHRAVPQGLAVHRPPWPCCPCPAWPASPTPGTWYSVQTHRGSGGNRARKGLQSAPHALHIMQGLTRPACCPRFLGLAEYLPEIGEDAAERRGVVHPALHQLDPEITIHARLRLEVRS